MTFPNLPNLPAYLAEETHPVILARMLQLFKDEGVDTSEGSDIHNLQAPGALEIAQLKSEFREGLKRGFALYTFGPYLRHIALQRAGITPNEKVSACTTLRFTGAVGAPVPAGRRVSTQVLPGSTTPAIEYVTLADATVGAGGTVEVLAQCSVAGAIGNVPAGALKVLMTTLDGITSVTNPYAVGDGPGDVVGADAESDVSLLGRYLEAVRNPPGSGSDSDIIKWVKEVPGVGGVYLEPGAYGPNTYRIVLIGQDMMPAPTALLEAVEDHLYAPHRIIREAETMTVGGSGTSVSGGEVVMAYSGAGAGTITDRLDLIPLPQPGIWRAMVRVKVDSTAGTDDLLQIGVYNLTTGAWATTSRFGTEQAVKTFRAADLGTTHSERGPDFFWNRSDQLELRMTRLQTDTTTQVTVDQVRFLSAFMKDDATPKASSNDRYYVEPAKVVPIAVSYHPVYATGAVPAVVDPAVEVNIAAYLHTLALAPDNDNDVVSVWVGDKILKTTGMLRYSNLLVNGISDTVVEIGPDEVAVLGTVTLT